MLAAFPFLMAGRKEKPIVSCNIGTAIVIKHIAVITMFHFLLIQLNLCHIVVFLQQHIWHMNCNVAFSVRDLELRVEKGEKNAPFNQSKLRKCITGDVYIQRNATSVYVQSKITSMIRFYLVTMNQISQWQPRQWAQDNNGTLMLTMAGVVEYY